MRGTGNSRPIPRHAGLRDSSLGWHATPPQELAPCEPLRVCGLPRLPRACPSAGLDEQWIQSSEGTDVCQQPYRRLYVHITNCHFLSDHATPAFPLRRAGMNRDNAAWSNQSIPDAIDRLFTCTYTYLSMPPAPYPLETALCLCLGVARSISNMSSSRFALGNTDPAAVAQASGEWRRFAAILNSHLHDRRWLTGNGLCIADFAVAAMLPYAEPARIPLGEFPAVRRWHDRLNELDAWREPFPSLAVAA